MIEVSTCYLLLGDLCMNIYVYDLYQTYNLLTKPAPDVCHCLSRSLACAPPPSLWPCCPRQGASVARLLLATS